MAQSAVETERFAVVVLVDDPKLRADLEDGVAAQLEGHGLDPVASHALAPNVRDVAKSDFLAVLKSRHVAGVFMLRPAPLGPGSSLQTVRSSVTPQMLRDFRAFAKRVSRIGPRESPAVVHIGVYLLEDGEPMLFTAGATWLDSDAGSRDEAVARLEHLVALNLEQAAPAIRHAAEAAP
ncbi:MAG TPA: hypothetical protein VFY39_10260, partial [Gammaproteobacteria bacterium]|nr:hypothetical protein [Gammaproteobacteria bacterium]